MKTEATLETPQVGKITMVTSESDWREIEGVKVPFKTLMDQSIQKIVIQVESIDFNTDVPAGKFELPGVIQKLVEKKAADEAAAGGGDADAPGHDGHDHDGHDHDDH